MKGILWQSPESNFLGIGQDINSYIEFENYTFKIIFTSPGGQWVNNFKTLQIIMQ